MALTNRQWIVMVIATLGVLANTTTYGVLAPFYPTEARLKENSEFQIGLVFSSFALLGLVSSPIVGYLLSNGVSSKIILITGMFIAGTFFSVMGSLHSVPAGTPFFVANLLCRLIQTLGASICSTCFYSIIAAELPDHKNLAIATLETMFGVGMMLGPAFGGFLYQIGGYPLPCYVFGGALCLVGLLSIFYLPRTKLPEQQESRIDWKSVNWQLSVDLLATLCALTIMNYNDVTLSGQLEHYGMTKGKMGLVFLICATVYALSSMIWGSFINVVGDSRILVVLGGLITAIGTFLMRPVEYCGVTITLPLQIGAQSLLGLGLSAMYVCSTLHGMHYAVHRLGFPDDISTHGFISGLFMTAMFCGCLIGPIVGGLIGDHYGYSRTLEVSTCFVLITVLLVISGIITDRVTKRRRERQLPTKDDYVIISGNDKNQQASNNKHIDV